MHELSKAQSMSRSSAHEGPTPGVSRWQWVIVVALSALAGAVLAGAVLTGPPAQAQAAAAGGGHGGVFALAGQLSRDNYGIFLVDSNSNTMAIYEWVSDKVQGRKLHLVAARNFAFDLQLDDYNNSEPLPREVKALVEQNRKLSATSQP
jgi:hypothetical protein